LRTGGFARVRECGRSVGAFGLGAFGLGAPGLGADGVAALISKPALATTAVADDGALPLATELALDDVTEPPPSPSEPLCAPRRGRRPEPASCVP